MHNVLQSNKISKDQVYIISNRFRNFTFIIWIGTVKTNLALFRTFLLFRLTFFLQGIGNIIGSRTLINAGAYAAILTAIAGLYIAFVIILAETLGIKPVLGRTLVSK